MSYYKNFLSPNLRNGEIAEVFDCLYVCVCMYVRMYECMNACMYVWMDGRVFVYVTAKNCVRG